MKNQVFRVDSDGFNGAWYPAPVKSGRGLIIMLKECGETQIDIDRRLKKALAEW